MTIWTRIIFFNQQEREVIESKLTQCIQLNADYREAYQKIKNKKVLFVVG